MVVALIKLTQKPTAPQETDILEALQLLCGEQKVGFFGDLLEIR